MKKNLRNILALALGLITTVSFAQEWNVDSRTRIDMSGDYDRMETQQRITISTDWSGSDWGIHASTDVNYDLTGLNAGASLNVYQAYAWTDLMGFATMKVGKMALDYGSGAIIGSNQWAGTGANSGTNIRNTRTGMIFNVNSLDFADITLGYANRLDGAELTNGATAYWLNAGGEMDMGLSYNLLYVNATTTTADVESDATTMMGLDLGYAIMDGNLGLNMSYNTMDNGTEMDMMMLGGTYSMGDFDLHASMTTYGENGFGTMNIDTLGNSTAILASNMGNGRDGSSWLTHGNLGYLNADDQNLSFGGSYSMGAFGLSASLHTITNDVNEDYERNAMQFGVSYSLTNNAGLSLNYATDDEGTSDTEETYMWLTLTINP